MMKTQMTCNATQAHSIYIQLEGSLAHFFGISPGLGVGRVLFYAEHADKALVKSAINRQRLLFVKTKFLGSFSHQVNIVRRNRSGNITTAHENEPALYLLANFDILAAGFVNLLA